MAETIRSPENNRQRELLAQNLQLGNTAEDLADQDARNTSLAEAQLIVTLHLRALFIWELDATRRGAEHRVQRPGCGVYL